MLEINSFDDIRGNNVVIYSIKKLLEKHTYPAFSIMSGHMGVGKSTVARLVAEQLCSEEVQPYVFNFGMEVNMKDLEEHVFKMNPSSPKAFIFEELHGLDKGQQTALLTMLDSQPSNVYIICTTTEYNRILPTIKSRATLWSFKLLGQRQLAQLLDDYLEMNDITCLSKVAKEALLHSARGVPRDLLKNTDLAVSGEFTGDQLNELLGRVSEDLMFSLFCALKSQAVGFTSLVESLVEQSNENKLPQLRDFWTRYLLEHRGIENPTLSRDKLKQLDTLYTDADAMKVGKALVKATPDTLILELVLLNMELTRTSVGYQIGQQKDRKANNTAQGVTVSPDADVASRRTQAKLTASGVSKLRLDS